MAANNPLLDDVLRFSKETSPTIDDMGYIPLQTNVQGEPEGRRIPCALATRKHDRLDA
jgi:hypothetical protein